MSPQRARAPPLACEGGFQPCRVRCPSNFRISAGRCRASLQHSSRVAAGGGEDHPRRWCEVPDSTRGTTGIANKFYDTRRVERREEHIAGVGQDRSLRLYWSYADYWTLGGSGADHADQT